MSSFVRPDDTISAPLNITAPTPSLDVKFSWGTVDEKIHGIPEPDHSHDHDGQRAFAASEEPAPTPWQKSPTGKPKFPIEQFHGSYAGNGYNSIFRPRANGPNELPVKPGDNAGPDDNILELNLTTEQLNFAALIGDAIPNRGLRKQKDIFLTGLPYIQTVQDVTYPDTGKGDNPTYTDIHFENGVWLNVPPSNHHGGKPSVVRMASIPHGTTINAQGFAPERDPNTITGGVKGGPKFPVINATPFKIGDPSNAAIIEGPPHRFQSMNDQRQKDYRIPQNLEKFNAGEGGSGRITTEIIKNPNLVLAKALEGLEVDETITFTLSTGPPESKLNGGGTANISFLGGKQTPMNTNLAPTRTEDPVAHAASMIATYWIERILYEVKIPAGAPPGTKLELRATMPDKTTAPTPSFYITTGSKRTEKIETIKVPGVQIQVSQVVLLNFSALTWPHVSVATYIPKDPQPFTMT